METYKVELNKKELSEISKLLNKEVKNNPELMVILSKLSLAYYEPLTNEIGEFITDKFNL
tara:strand:+ start:3784 stop:3963 length:180 start_codon:yes stop_codon:yes gene_type:complete